MSDSYIPTKLTFDLTLSGRAYSGTSNALHSAASTSMSPKLCTLSSTVVTEGGEGLCVVAS